MTPVRWFLVGLGAGLATLGIPVGVYAYRFIKEWDRTWGF